MHAATNNAAELLPPLLLLLLLVLYCVSDIISHATLISTHLLELRPTRFLLWKAD